MAPTLVRLSLVLAFALACTGSIGDTATDPNPRDRDPSVPVTCDEVPGSLPAPLLRVSRDEHRAALVQLFGDPAVGAIASALSVIPEDHAEEGDVRFARTDQRLTFNHVDGWFRAADALAAAVATDATLRRAVVGECAATAVDDACLASFASAFLRRAQRRTPTSAELEDALARTEEFSGLERVHALVFSTLMSPDFLYRFENRGVVDGDSIALTDHELATRLSFHFWGAPPDDALLAAADDGALSTEDGFAEQVERLSTDTRAEVVRQEFFREWFHLDRGDFTESPRLQVLRDGMDVEGLAAEMRAEVDDLVAFHEARGDTWADVIRSPYSFARTERLADIYGVAVWDGASEPPLLPADERSGLLTRAGMLYTSDGSTNPFRRGAFIRRSILCDPVRPPPNDLPPDALTPPPTEPGTTTRESFAAKVEGEPCASCHAAFTPLGYAFEAYDGLGRFRAEEWLVTTDGTDHGFAPVDSSTTPSVDSGDTSASSGPVDLSARIADSPKANECFAEQYLAFTFRRPATGEDACVAVDMARRIDEGMSLSDALRAVALSPSFRNRRLEP